MGSLFPPAFQANGSRSIACVCVRLLKQAWQPVFSSLFCFCPSGSFAFAKLVFVFQRMRATNSDTPRFLSCQRLRSLILFVYFQRASCGGKQQMSPSSEGCRGSCARPQDGAGSQGRKEASCYFCFGLRCEQHVTQKGAEGREGVKIANENTQGVNTQRAKREERYGTVVCNLDRNRGAQGRFIGSLYQPILQHESNHSRL